jgi:hypothetical protein
MVRGDGLMDLAFSTIPSQMNSGSQAAPLVDSFSHTFLPLRASFESRHRRSTGLLVGPAFWASASETAVPIESLIVFDEIT